MKKTIYDIIEKNSPIKREKLLRLININWSGNVSDRRMRHTIKEMIKKDKCKIQSSHKGYSVISSSDQAEAAILYLKKKGWALFERASNIHRNYYGNNAQLSIEEFLQKT
ncbi:MAG: hypothetical protein ACUZ8E_07075 [Candidatus Anammoxibacter sp.]